MTTERYSHLPRRKVALEITILILGALLAATFTAQADSATNSPPPSQVVYDLSQGYSTAANPAGPWSHGWKGTIGGAFSTLPYGKSLLADNGVPIFAWQLTPDALPSVAKVIGPGTAISASGQFVAPAGTLYFTAGSDGTPQNFGAVRFTVPSGGAGNYRIETSVRDVFDGSFQGDTDFHVVCNGVELFGQFLPAHQATGFSNVVALARGDTVDFLIGRGQDGHQAGSGLKLAATLTLATNVAPLEDLIRLVSALLPPVNPQPPLASLEAAHASIARGNVRAAIHQLGAFQNKVRAQVAPLDSALADQLIQLAQQIIESLDPTGARRAALAAAAATPLRAVRLVPAANGAFRLEGCAVPGVICCVQRSANLEAWEHAGFAVEVDDGMFEFVDPLPPTGPARFFRLFEP